MQMNNIQNETQIIVDKIAKNYKPEKIILFGSAARGEENKDSDIDLLIIKKSSQKRPFRVKEVYQALRGLKRNTSIDAIVYTPEEITNRLNLGDYFIKRVLKEGKILYESQ